MENKLKELGYKSDTIYLKRYIKYYQGTDNYILVQLSNDREKIENCYNYLIVSEDKEVIEELKDLVTDPATTINWNNFETGDIYYSENCEEYSVKASHHMNMIVLNKVVKM